MDVRQLAALVAIADHGSFSAAARALYTVQSNVSGHIAKLERELGTTLVDRTTGTVTESGARVIERARRIIHELDDIAADMASIDDEVAGEVRLGVIGTTARWLMPQLLGAIDAAHPRVHIVATEGSTSSLVPNVLSGRLGAAVVHLPVDDPELVIEPLFAEDLVLVTRCDHPLAVHDTLDLEALRDIPLLLPPPGAALRRVLDRAATGVGITLRAQAEIDGVRLLASLAFDGYGVAIVPATAIPRRADADLCCINVPQLPRRVVAWVRRRRPAPTGAVHAVGATLRSVIEASATDQPGVHLSPTALPASRAT
jgi:molybdate transport repressor ModE-like protein